MAKKRAFDRLLFSALVVLLAFGLTMVYSASAVVGQDPTGTYNPFLVRQGVAAAAGLGLLWLAMHLDYRKLARPAAVYALLGLVVAALVAVLFQPPLNGTRRWIFLGPFSLQPSEAAKPAVVLFLAFVLHRSAPERRDWERLVPCALPVGLVCGLIMLQPDLGTAVLVGLVGATVLFLAGLRWRYLVGGVLVLAPVIGWSILTAPYRIERLLAFLHPERDPLGAGFQARQSLIAVGSGGLTGLGLGDSLQKLYFLPHPHSDFIYSIIAEELGMVGALAVIGLFGVVAWRGFRAGRLAPDRFGRYLAWGLTSILVLQALLHVSVALALVPTTGVPLPFISAGGSSLVVSLAIGGVLLNVTEHT